MSAPRVVRLRAVSPLVLTLLAACGGTAAPNAAQENESQNVAQGMTVSPIASIDPGVIVHPPFPLIPLGQTLTQHGNNARTGANLSESTLTPANVAPATFGRLATRRLDGAVLAQPLYAKAIGFSAGTKNAVYVATAHNTVYAFDADDPTPGPSGGVLVQRTFEPPQVGGICPETWGPVGITSTPAIDWLSNAMYLTTRTNGAYWLHKVDLGTLADVVTPVQIGAKIVTSGTTLTFDANVQRQRPGILLQNGTLYLGFGTYSCDQGDYHGWVIAYDASSLQRMGAYSSTHTAGSAGGIWQTGAGLVGDGTNVYFMTGNGVNDPANGQLAQAFVRLSPHLGPAVGGVDTLLDPAPLHLTADQADLLTYGPSGVTGPRGDVDLASGGPMLLPGNRVLGGGKDGRVYLMDAPTMTRLDLFQAFYNEWHADWGNHDPSIWIGGNDAHGNSQYDGCAVHNNCYISETDYRGFEKAGPNIHGGLVYFPGAGADYGMIYGMPEKERLKGYRYHPSTGVIDHPLSWNAVANRNENVPAVQSTALSPNGMSGGALSISANGSSNGIVWAQYPKEDTMWLLRPGRIAAFDALTGTQLWSDEDDLAFAKAVPPTIGDGKVFRATAGETLVIYGLKSPANDPADPCYSIDEKFAHYGGAEGELGPATTPDTETPNGQGHFKHYQNGASIYSLNGDCGHVIYGSIRGRWQSLGWETFQGFPITDERVTSDNFGRYNDFQTGSIYWTPDTGAWEIHGAIRDHWRALGSETSPVGYPLTNESTTPDGVGRYNHFQRTVAGGGIEYGSIYWTPSTGAWSIHGLIRGKWASMGWETSVLGYPTTDETGTPDGVGRFNHFLKGSAAGSIYWTPATGAHETHGLVRDKWSSMGWERSSLGYPTSDVTTTNVNVTLLHYTVYSQTFQHGTISCNSLTGLSGCSVN